MFLEGSWSFRRKMSKSESCLFATSQKNLLFWISNVDNSKGTIFVKIFLKAIFLRNFFW